MKKMQVVGQPLTKDVGTTIYKICFWLVSLLCLIKGLAYGQEKDFPLIHINQVKNSPVIDGEITPGEWDRATEVMNFRVLGSGDVSTYRTRFYITFDEKNLYVGWECFVPRQEFMAKVTERDHSFWKIEVASERPGLKYDDSVEFFFDPDNIRTKDSYYQFIVNSIGGVMDISQRSGGGGKKWDPNITHKEKQFNDRWSGEMIIPFSSFGLSGAPKDGTSWGLNFCRNQITAFSGDFPAEFSMWSYTGAKDVQPGEFGYLIFDSGCPVVKLLSLGEFGALYENKCIISVENLQKEPREVRAILNLVPENGEKKSTRRTVWIKNRKIHLFYQPDEFNKQYKISIELSDVSTGKIYYSTGAIPFRSLPPIRVKLMPLYYQNILKVEVNTQMLTIPHEMLDIFIMDKGKVVEKKREQISAGEKVISLNMDKLSEETSYVVHISALDQKGKEVMSRVIDYYYPRKFDWFNSKAGVSDEILPPWTPLEVSKNSIKCWGREYVFSNGMWPSQILTRGSEILDSPIQLVAKIGDEVLTFTDGKVEIKENKPNRVILTYKDNSSLIKLDGQINIEYDGMIWCTFKLNPSVPVQVDSLSLNISIKSSHGKYYQYRYHVHREMPENTTGAVGEDGWMKEMFFQPHIWIGDEDRGLSWFTESDEGWLPYDRKDIMTIRHEEGKVILSMNILKQIELSEPLSLSMGLEATPVKPYPVNYKTGYLSRKAHFYGGPGNFAESHWDRWFDQHMKFLEDSSNAGVKSVIFHSYWANGFGRTEPYDHEKFKKLVFDAHKKNMLLGVYLASGNFDTKFPEIKMMKYEWDLFPGQKTGESLSGMGGRPDQTLSQTCPAAPGYADYLAHGVKRLIEEYDIDGVYYDSLYPQLCYSTFHGHGYWTKDGKRRVTFPILETRELAKRIYTLFKTMKKESIIENHTSGGLVIPINAFVDCFLEGEQFDSNSEHIYKLDLFRAEFMGNQYGLVPDVLLIGTRPERYALALALPHESFSRFLDMKSRIWQIFDEFDINSAEWFPYWNNSHLVKVSMPEVILSFYKGKKGLLLIVTNWTSRDVNAEVEIDFSALGFSSSNVTLIGVELPASKNLKDNRYDKEPVVLSGSKFSINIEKYNFRMIKAVKKR